MPMGEPIRLDAHPARPAPTTGRPAASHHTQCVAGRHIFQVEEFINTNMLTTDDIFDRLDGLTFTEAVKELGLLNSYERTTAMVLVMARAPTAADRLRVFLDWGNVCDAPWWNRSWI